jgi:hypothetical protein
MHYVRELDSLRRGVHTPTPCDTHNAFIPNRNRTQEEAFDIQGG